MSRNLVKSYFLTRENSETKIINTNELVAKRLETIQSLMQTEQTTQGGFEQVDMFGNAPVVDPLDLLSADSGSGQAGVSDNEGIVSETVDMGPSREEMLRQAEEEIAAMKESARAEIEAERAKVMEEAYAEGFAKGEAEGRQECDSIKDELEAQKKTLLESYENQIEQLEPKFITTLTDIYEKVIAYDIEDKKPLVLGMLRNAMRRLDGYKNYLIHVSGIDYLYVKEHKEELISESAGENVVIDIVEDNTMKESECCIETASGIYDCGLGTQLQELKKKLMLLCYEA